MYYFDETVVLKNQQNLFGVCDFLVHDGTGGVAQELQQNPRRLEAFLREIDTVHDDAVIFVKSSMMQGFFETAFPRLNARFVLVTAGEDCSTPGPYYRYLDDQRIIRWFGYNCDLVAPHPKFEIIPLGFADPHWPHGDQAAMLRVHRRMPPVADKPLKTLASFHLKMSHPDRYRVWAKLRSNSEIAFEPRRIPPELLWIRHVKYAFEICPRGNGLDCHRTWEALLLRTIPIVRTSDVRSSVRRLPGRDCLCVGRDHSRGDRALANAIRRQLYCGNVRTADARLLGVAGLGAQRTRSARRTISPPGRRAQWRCLVKS